MFLRLFLIGIFLGGCGVVQIASSSPNGTDGAVLVQGSVNDGDTFRAILDGQETRIRLCGIDAPESKQPLGAEAQSALEEIVLGGMLRLYPVETDRYGRTIAEVFVVRADGSEVFANEAMVAMGMAYHYAQFSDNCPNQRAIALAEEQAQRQGMGVWAQPGGGVRPWDWRRQQRGG